MGKQLDVDKAKRILPANAVPNVAELNSNFTLYVAEVNPETTGESADSIDCGSVAEVAENFKPKVEFGISKVNNLGSGEPELETVSAVMNYGEQPKDIMNDFNAENLVVKTKTSDGERVLLDQQLTYLALQDLEEKLKDQKFRALFEKSKDALIASLEEEIEKVKSIQSESDFEGSFLY